MTNTFSPQCLSLLAEMQVDDEIQDDMMHVIVEDLTPDGVGEM